MFHGVTARMHRLLWSLPTIAPRVEFRTRYHGYLIMGALRWDVLRFQPQGAWVTITIESLRREEFEHRGITTKTVRNIFPLLYVPPPPALLASS